MNFRPHPLSLAVLTMFAVRAFDLPSCEQAADQAAKRADDTAAAGGIRDFENSRVFPF